jgi:hypothetical protein
MGKISFCELSELFSSGSFGTTFFLSIVELDEVIDYNRDYKPHLRLVQLVRDYLSQMQVVSQMKSKLLDHISREESNCMESSGRKSSILDFREQLLTRESSILERISNFGVNRIIYFSKGNAVHKQIFGSLDDFLVEYEVANDIKKEFIDKVNFLFN